MSCIEPAEDGAAVAAAEAWAKAPTAVLPDSASTKTAAASGTGRATHTTSIGSAEAPSLDRELGDQADVLVVDFDGPGDPLRPENLPLWRRVLMTALVLWGTFVVQTDGTLYSTAHVAIARDLHVTEATISNTYWPITSWALGAAAFSLLGLPLMEDLGVYFIYLGTWAALILFILPEAYAGNFATLIVARFFVGGCVSVLANSGATALVGLWADWRIRSHLLGIWVVSYVAGASLGPVLGAAIFKYLSWRWTFKMQLIYYALMFPLYVLGMTEVREPAILASKARRLRRSGQNAVAAAARGGGKSPGQIVWGSVSRPLLMLAQEPVLAVCFVWIAFLFGNVYNFTQSVEQVFSNLYGWSPIEANLVQAAVVVGEVLGLSGVLANNYLFFRSARRTHDGAPLPEARLYTAVPGSLVGLVGGMMMYAWTSHASVPWAVPAVALGVVGWGSALVLNSVCDYLVDAYHSVAGSAMSALTLGETVMIAFLPLSAQPMYTHLGFQWASTTLALISLAFAVAPLVIIRYGERIRARSRYMTAPSAGLGRQDESETFTLAAFRSSKDVPCAQDLA